MTFYGVWLIQRDYQPMQTNINGSEQSQVVPFLKWAGGKRWLLNRNEKIFPSEFNSYFEPFLGGGAVLFTADDAPFVVSDINGDLIDCYKAIQDDFEEVEKYLKIHQRHHCKDYYYKVRSSKPRKSHTKAAKFIYLNRTCWNGLYRVNLKGEFNVPIGTKTNVLLGADDFGAISSRLKKGKILCQDFEKTLKLAKKGDFVFVDPPYTVKHNYNGFLKYNEKIFSWDDQVRLKESIVESVNRGVMVTMTNADHESIRNLYSDVCEIDRIDRNSVIAGSSSHRGLTSEVIMRIGWTE